MTAVTTFTTVDVLETYVRHCRMNIEGTTHSDKFMLSYKLINPLYYLCDIKSQDATFFVVTNDRSDMTIRTAKINRLSYNSS